MNKSIEEGAKLTNILLHGSLMVRIIGIYLWVYVFVTFITMLLADGLTRTSIHQFIKSITFGFINAEVLICSVPAILFIIFFEFLRYRYSKKHDLPRWKDSTEILAEREYKKQKLEEEEYMKKQAKINLEANKNSLDYWFDLKQKGAITSEEYDKKKNELLSK